MHEQDKQKIVEAVLFASPGPLTARQLAGVVGNTKPAQVRGLIEALNREYEKTGRTFRIVPLGEGFQMRTLPLYKTWIHKTEPLKPTRLTQPTLETLAIVAYRQPVTRAEVEHLRGVDSSSGLRTLLDKRLIRIVGKDKSPGRPLLYGTTKQFLSLFNLQSLKDLPTLEDFDLGAAASGTERQAGGEAG